MAFHNSICFATSAGRFRKGLYFYFQYPSIFIYRFGFFWGIDDCSAQSHNKRDDSVYSFGRFLFIRLQIASRVGLYGYIARHPAQDFVAAVLGNTEDTWREIFKNSGQQYSVPRLRLYSGVVQGGCGMAQAAMGPFYCPNDRRIYLDTSFFRDIQARFRGCSGKACEFAEAYVIAHEVGHHVQNLLGILPQVQNAQRSAGSKVEANRLQVRVELQADCLAGVWAHRADRAKSILEQGDVEEALGAASAIGDDQIQRKTQGYVVPDAFTHGSSAQRVRWFKRGLQSGQLKDCDTFSARDL